ncbi:MAG: flagellar basal body rod C-terminal domain-containing protein, partial [bacterium]
SGRLWSHYSKDSTTQAITYDGVVLPFTIGLVTFPNSGGLEQRSGTAFAETLASGAPSTAAAPAEGSAQGAVSPRLLEQSNVFYVGETIDALEVQRAMSGNLTVIKMVSDTISQFINSLQ